MFFPSGKIIIYSIIVVLRLSNLHLCMLFSQNMYGLAVNIQYLCTKAGFPGGSVSKESACNAGDLGLIPRSERSFGERNGHFSVLA